MSTFNRLHLIRQVDLFTLKLFVSAVEEQQIGLAAIRENIAASTATKRIQDLEDIAGVKLLERGPKGVSPSPAGAVLLRYIRKIFDDLDDMRSEIASFTDGMQGELTIASARSIIVPFLSREVGEFSREYPLVELVMQELENAEIVQAVVRGEADVGVFAATHELDLGGVDVTPYREDRLIAVVPKGHRLSEQASVTFKDLLPENVIAVTAMLGRYARPRGGWAKSTSRATASGARVSQSAWCRPGWASPFNRNASSVMNCSAGLPCWNWPNHGRCDAFISPRRAAETRIRLCVH